MRKDLMNNNQHHYLNELNFPTNRDLKNLFGSFYNLLDLCRRENIKTEPFADFRDVCRFIKEI